MNFRVSILMENNPLSPEFKAEHGLSILIEGGGRKVLFDTGAGPAFMHNARIMGLDLGGLDALVLSHCHYDHTGGLEAVLDISPPPDTICVGKNFFDARYAREQSGLLRPNGCLLSERDIRARGAKLRLCNGEIIPLFENMYLVSGFSSTDPNERPLERFLRDKGGEYITDLFVEEVALVLMTRDGPALISGCAHNGVVSTCKKAGEILGRPIVTFIGGTHLQDSDAGRIEYSLKALLNMGIKRLGACHCNGSEANEYFARHYDGFFVNNAGSQLTL